MAKFKPTAAETVADAASVIYCGPTLPKAQLVSLSIFRGGLPKYVQDLIAKTPEIGRLIVPVDKLAPTQQRTRTPGTEEHRLYQAILASRRGESSGV